MTEKQTEKPEQSKSQRNIPQKNTPLTPAQITVLDSIGMIWNAQNYAWERAFAAAEAYYKEHGNLLVPINYTQDGVNLSNWLRTQRQVRLGTLKNRKAPMSEEQIWRLDSIGMAWQPYDAMWERSFAVAEKYYREHGNLSVPKNYEEDGVNLSHLGAAAHRERDKGREGTAIIGGADPSAGGNRHGVGTEVERVFLLL